MYVIYNDPNNVRHYFIKDPNYTLPANPSMHTAEFTISGTGTRYVSFKLNGASQGTTGITGNVTFDELWLQEAEVHTHISDMLVQVGSEIIYQDDFNLQSNISDAAPLASFKYNAAGERVEKTVNTGMVDKYIMAQGKMMSAYTSDGKRRNYMYDGVGRRVALSFHVGSWSGNYFFYKDMLGSVREFARADQSFVYRRDYYPFGQDRGATGGLANPEHFRFTGKAEDAETGLYYFGARYYDSEPGRWTQPDPLWAKYPGWSPYNYALNNPLKYVDPDGRKVNPAWRNNEFLARGVGMLVMTKPGRAIWNQIKPAQSLLF